MLGILTNMTSQQSSFYLALGKTNHGNVLNTLTPPDKTLQSRQTLDQWNKVFIRRQAAMCVSSLCGVCVCLCVWEPECTPLPHRTTDKPPAAVTQIHIVHKVNTHTRTHTLTPQMVKTSIWEIYNQLNVRDTYVNVTHTDTHTYSDFIVFCITVIIQRRHSKTSLTSVVCMF